MRVRARGSRADLLAAVVSLAIATATGRLCAQVDWHNETRPSPPSRTSHGMTFDAASGRTIVFGGRLDGSGPVSRTTLWDGLLWTFPVIAIEPPPRFRPAMAFDFVSMQTLLFGGQSSTA